MSISELLREANAYVAKAAPQVTGDYRPLYHMMPPIGWINDPNGFCFYKGVYHLYYQFHPYSPENKLMYWAHSQSLDLYHWEYMGVAVAPDTDYDCCGVFSGTTLVEDEMLTLMYTGVNRLPSGEVRQTQCIAYSTDSVNYTKDKNNPVIGTAALPPDCKPQDFRDPKLWKRGDMYYCLVVAVDPRDFGKLLLYRSEDKRKWEYFSTPLSGYGLDLGNLWECPDFFELNGKDIIIVSTANAKPQGEKFNGVNSVAYFIGKMDWETGIYAIESFDQLDNGGDFYAPQTILNDKGQRILIAWQQCWGRDNVTAKLGHGWAGCMTLPRLLELQNGKVRQSIMAPPEKISAPVIAHIGYIGGQESAFDGVQGRHGRLQVEVLTLTPNGTLQIKLLASGDEYVLITYEQKTGLITLDRTHTAYCFSGAEMVPGAANRAAVQIGAGLSRVLLEIYLDESCIEIALPHIGQIITSRAFTKARGEKILFSAENTANLKINWQKWSI